MPVLLPTTTVRVLTRQETLDAHGAATTYAWTERGPFDCAVARADAGEDLTDFARTTYRHVLVVDDEAWPVRENDRLVDAEGGVYEVIGATLHRDPSGRGMLDHVSVECRRMVGVL